MSLPNTSSQSNVCDIPLISIETIVSDNMVSTINIASQTQNTANRIDFEDASTWPWPFPKSDLKAIVKFGANQISGEVFPLTKGRRFNTKYYMRLMKNGEILPRNWLVYSKNNNAVYCFPCKLFSRNSIALTTTGFSDWNHLTRHLKEHETSACHMMQYKCWKTFERDHNKSLLIDDKFEKQIDAETLHW